MEQQQLHIEDGSNDKRYFTLIPNYILNHSTLWDREVYIQMKRIAGENGVCWTSRKELSKQCGISLDRLKKSLKYLLEHEWIKFTGIRRVMTKGGMQNCNQYKITDLWRLNTQYYQEKSKGGSPKNPPIEKQRGVAVGTKGGSPNDYKEEPYTTYKKNPRAENLFSAQKVKKINPLAVITDHYLEFNLNDTKDYRRHLRAAKQLLELCDGNTDRACQILDKTNEWIKSFGGEEWYIETSIKKFLEIDKLLKD